MGRLFILVFVLSSLLVACDSAGPSPTSVPPTATRVATATPMPLPRTAEERGRLLFRQMQRDAGFTCASCHLTSTEQRLVGPGLHNIATRITADGLDAADYIRESIVAPNAIIKEGYAENIMPNNYGDIFTERELDDLLAYLLSLTD